MLSYFFLYISCLSLVECGALRGLKAKGGLGPWGRRLLGRARTTWGESIHVNAVTASGGDPLTYGKHAGKVSRTYGKHAGKVSRSAGSRLEGALCASAGRDHGCAHPQAHLRDGQIGRAH